MTEAKLVEVLETSLLEIRQCLACIQKELAQLSRGFELVYVAEAWQLRTKLSQNNCVSKFLEKPQSKKDRSPGLMEVLAIIAYEQQS